MTACAYEDAQRSSTAEIHRSLRFHAPIAILQNHKPAAHFFPPFLLFIGCFLKLILFVTFRCLLLAILACFASLAFFLSVLLRDRVAPSASVMVALSASAARILSLLFPHSDVCFCASECQPSEVWELLKAKRRSPFGSKPMISLEAPRRWKKSCSLASCCCPARSSIGVAGVLLSVEGVAGGVGSWSFGLTVKTLWGIGIEREGVPSAAAPEAFASVLVGSVKCMLVTSSTALPAGLLCDIPSSTSISSLGGFGCAISACSFAFRRSFRAFSAGEKTFFLSALLFFLTRLARSPLAIVVTDLTSVL